MSSGRGTGRGPGGPRRPQRHQPAQPRTPARPSGPSAPTPATAPGRTTTGPAARPVASGSTRFQPGDPKVPRPPIVGQDRRAAFSTLSDAHPLLLLPVRIETRFGGRELSVRVYPDAIHQDAHEEALTAAELELGRAFWTNRLAAGDDVLRGAVDDWLVAQLPARRAAWVARATRPDIGSDGALAFPSPATRTSTTPASALALPARWAVSGWVNGTQRFVRFGAPIPPDLAFAPSLDGAVARAGGDGRALPVDAGFAWMTDYREAVKVGMAMTVRLDEALYADVEKDGLALVVVGVSDASPDEGSSTLAGLLQAHRYTDGLELLPQGTPTNNTDEGIAGWTADVVDTRDLLSRELDGLAPELGQDSDAARLASALGLESSAPLRGLLYGERGDEASARAMNRALWPVTWGRYLSDLLAPEGRPSIAAEDVQRELREWFVSNVRGGAALPTLGVGSQPYAVLPVRRTYPHTAPSGWHDTLEWVLRSLRERWRDSLPAVPRLDPVVGDAIGADPPEDAVALLGTVPHPGRFVVRRLTYQRELRLFFWSWAWTAIGESDHPLYALGRWYRDRAGSLGGIDDQIDLLSRMRDQVPSLVSPDHRSEAYTVVDALIAMAEAHQARQAPVSELFGGSVDGVFDADRLQDPKVFWSGYGNATADRVFTRPLVQAPDAGDGETAWDYLGVLRDRIPGVRAMRETMAGGRPGASVVGALTSRNAGVRSLGAARDLAKAPLVSKAPSVRPAHDLTDAFHANEPLLYQLIDATLEALPKSERTRYRSALEALRATAPEEIELRLRETLGLASYRLDAWLGGFARERLDAMRGSDGGSPTGLQLGGWGYVEDLRPDGSGTAESQGFIHTPSMAHAATAAVLRSGWNAHGGRAADSTLAVDLKSDRVRLASWILDGVRQGQALGDLLGYRFERRLHDEGLDEFLDDCRRAVLVSKGVRRDPHGPVDGLELAELYESAGVTVEDGSVVLTQGSTPADPRVAAVRSALDGILTDMDAVADAGLADAVHHYLQGNTARASATLDALSTGATPPPELRALRTPRASVGVVHRLMLTFGPGAARATAWGESPRARLLPALDAWVATLLPDPSLLVCSAAFKATEAQSAAGLVAPGAARVTMADLVASFGVAAIDAVLGAPEAEAGDTEWRRLVGGHLLAQAAYAPFEAGLKVDFDAGGLDLAENAVTFAELADLARTLRSLVTGARALDDRDLAMPGAEADAHLDLDEAEARVRAQVATFRAAERSLAALLAELDAAAAEGLAPADATAVALRAAMTDLLGFALRGAVPERGWAGDEAGWTLLHAEARALAGRAATTASALDQLDAESAAADAGHAEGGTPSDAERLGRALRGIECLHGRVVPLLPLFTPANGAAPAAAVDGSDTLLRADPARAVDWLRKVAKVRAGAGRLAEVMDLSEWLVDAVTVRPRVGQLPAHPDEGWAAVEAPADPKQGRVAFFVVDDGGLEAMRAGTPLCGLVVDAWADALPAAEITSGLALHFDAPSSRPPQALLLMVPPEGESWSFDLVLDTLMETVEAAKLRAVDPDVLLGYGHQFPAVFAPGSLDAGPQPETT